LRSLSLSEAKGNSEAFEKEQSDFLKDASVRVPTTQSFPRERSSKKRKITCAYSFWCYLYSSYKIQ